MIRLMQTNNLRPGNPPVSSLSARRQSETRRMAGERKIFREKPRRYHGADAGPWRALGPDHAIYNRRGDQSATDSRPALDRGHGALPRGTSFTTRRPTSWQPPGVARCATLSGGSAYPWSESAASLLSAPWWLARTPRRPLVCASAFRWSCCWLSAMAHKVVSRKTRHFVLIAVAAAFSSIRRAASLTAFLTRRRT